MAIKINGSIIVDNNRNIIDATSIGIGVTNTTLQLDVAGDANISGITTLGNVRISSGIITSSSGIVTYFGDGSQLSNLPSSGINQILNDGSVVGTSITSLNFSSSNLVATAVGSAATITLSDNPSFNNLDVTGISSAQAFANFNYLQAPHNTTVTFTVTVASKNDSHRYYNTGSGNAYLINGVQAPFLTLTPGITYRFTNDNTGSHPLKFYLEADKTTEYTSGVNFQNTYTEITVSDQTPTVLHYQCTAHAYMGNAIQTNSNVVNTNYPAVIRDTLNVSGVSTFQSNVNLSGVGNTATITGPSNLIIDPAVVGNNTGLVRIKGDLFVDGTTTQINSTSLEIADFIVGIATTATTDLLTDGAGIQIGPDNTFLYEFNGGTNPSLKSSENLNVASGKGYQVNQTEVLNATTLGSGVVNSSLTSVGTLGSLTVSGDITANGNIVGDNVTNISGINSVTASSFVGNLTGTATAAGIATYTSEWILGANGSSDYTFTGPGFTGAENDPTLYLTRGQQYKFTNNSGGSHPFRIQSTPNGSTGTQYNDGITNNDTSTGTLTWNVQFDAPDILYYQCTNHSGMGGKIYIVNAGIASDVSINTTGIITATSFSGSGASLTAVDAATLDGIDSTQFLRSDAADIKSAGSLTFNDNIQALFGNSADLKIYHNGTNSQIENQGGSLNIDQTVNDNDINLRTDDGSGSLANYIKCDGSTGESILYHYGSQKLATKSNGIAVSGIVTASSGIVTYYGDGSQLTGVDADTLDTLDSTQFLRSDAFDIKTSGHLVFNDNVAAQFGTSQNLQISHTGTIGVISNDTGSLNIINEGSTFIQGPISGGGAASYIGVNSITREVTLSYDNSDRLITKSDGIAVSGIVTAVSGVVTYYGDGSKLTGVEAASFLFNTGISNSVSTVATGVGSTILTLPSTAGKKYIVHSILASNIAVGNTEVNFVGAFDFDGGERSYFAHQIPIPTGTSVEMLKQPQVLNPNDNIIVRSTDFDRVGANDIINVYVSYEEKTSTDLIGIGIGTVGLALTSTTGIYTSSTYPSVVQSIRLVNKVDTGPKIASVSISNGVTTSFLVDNLIVPKYGSVELLDNPKSIQTNDVVQVQLDEGASIDVQLSAKKITN